MSPTVLILTTKLEPLHPQTCEAVKKYRADVGISLDGDADRVIMVMKQAKLLMEIISLQYVHFI